MFQTHQNYISCHYLKHVRCWNDSKTRTWVMACRSISRGVMSTVVCEQNTLFAWALALRSFSRNCFPAPDLALRKPIFLIVFFSGGVFFSQTPVSLVKSDNNNNNDNNSNNTTHDNTTTTTTTNNNNNNNDIPQAGPPFMPTEAARAHLYNII